MESALPEGASARPMDGMDGGRWDGMVGDGDGDGWPGWRVQRGAYRTGRQRGAVTGNELAVLTGPGILGEVTGRPFAVHEANNFTVL